MEIPQWIQVVVALIGLAGVVIGGIFGIIQAQLKRRVNKVEEKSVDTLKLETENNILEQLIPLLERKDDALDRIAIILEQYGARIEYLERGQDNLAVIAREKCLAPVLIEEIQRYKSLSDEKEGVQRVLSAILNEKEV
jgi:hypothetical protein